MKYDHRVKVGGKWFDAGVEVDVKASTPVKPEIKTDNAEKKAEETVEQSGLTRTQIQQMNGTELRETTTQLGVEFGEDTTNKELKQQIMGKLGI